MADTAMRRAPFEIKSSNPAHDMYLGHNLSGRTLGIIGLGNIGIRVAQLAQAFGMKIIAYNKSKKRLTGITQVPMHTLLKQSDVVSLHVPLMPSTERLIRTEQFRLMKPTATIINTARGKLIDETALIAALRNGRIAGAGLDVVTGLDAHNPLLKMKNVTLSPHAAFFTQESLSRAADAIIENVRAFIQGKPINVIS